MSVVGPDGTLWPADSLRGIEHASIRAFVQSAADEGYLSGRVLDYGCGKQPYREIVESAGGYYIGYDDPALPASVVDKYVGDWSETDPIDAILCTQVVQYLPQGFWFAPNVFHSLKKGGHLVMTYPTNWPEVEPEDLHRFTKAGMERLLREAGFEIVRHERRAAVGWTLLGPENLVRVGGDEFALGYGVIARA